ncbi:ATP synthase, H+ transporting, mitochondrial F1 complex, delta subunit [Chelydra serpentina]|uniref:ATP synthase F(1) complex subunit delta, mitochondrial n=1 Tax=Chelydra serpentina TaxID=8475 RepID=A0A8T1TAS5_CHESE|nr:ATP synthase, H+ transporting, mitochondrial F1 complex, delta subunit [Chelydra serpentina]
MKQVDVLTLSGSFGILAAHVPTLQVLKPGVVTVFAQDGTATRYFSNVDKALSQLAAAPDETANVEAQINVEASEALVKALE